MDELEKNKKSGRNSFQSAQNMIQNLGLAGRANPYANLVQNIGLTTENTGIFKLAKTIGGIAGSNNLSQRLLEIDAGSVALSKSVASIAMSVVKVSSTFIQNLSIIQGSLGGLVNRMDWNSLVIPGLSEEEKQNRIKAFQQWGAYGWTVIPHANFKFFNEAPSSRKEANQKALSYFKTQKQMEEFWSLFKDVEKLKQSDFEEAVKDFEKHCYKSCAMMLYSLIDGRLIRLQGNPKTENLKQDAKTKRKSMRYSGASAARKINDKYTEVHEEDAKQWLFSNLTRENLFCALAVLYANGNDFKTQPDVVNRNFIDHGMLHRKVRRMDCIQLLLAYYNFLTFEERLTSEDRREMKGIG